MKKACLWSESIRVIFAIFLSLALIPTEILRPPDRRWWQERKHYDVLIPPPLPPPPLQRNFRPSDVLIPGVHLRVCAGVCLCVLNESTLRKLPQPPRTFRWVNKYFPRILLRLRSRLERKIRRGFVRPSTWIVHLGNMLLLFRFFRLLVRFFGLDSWPRGNIQSVLEYIYKCFQAGITIMLIVRRARFSSGRCCHCSGNTTHVNL